ncbi:hypothetical protein ACTL6U_20370 [Rhodovibrionaceae bacterium A322]
MAANRFSTDEWSQIFAELDAEAAASQPFGLPERRGGSVVLSSFNIRALGNPSTRTTSHKKGRTQGAWDLLARFVSRCDFVAIQEVKDDLEGVIRLKNSLDDAEKYALVVSDVTGARVGKDKTQERLAFLYRWDRIERSELASDLTYDRRAILETLYNHRADFIDDLRRHEIRLARHAQKVADFKAGKRTTKPGAAPKIELSRFLTFIRTPHVASFKIKGAGPAADLPFLAVNAHLLYGESAEERAMEFDALVDWLIWRTGSKDRLYHKNMILFGDLNLEFEARFRSLSEADDAIKAMNQKVGSGYKVNFPFLDVPKVRQASPLGNGLGRYFSTARMTQTYDQIGFFGLDAALPLHSENDDAGLSGPDHYDYGVFSFADLFTRALKNKERFLTLTEAQQKAFYKRYEHDVSDHHPIWTRLPIPG